MFVLDLSAINQHIMPYYQLATAAPTQVAAMLPSIGGMRADKLEVRLILTGREVSLSKINLVTQKWKFKNFVDFLNSFVTVKVFFFFFLSSHLFSFRVNRTICFILHV